MLVNPEDTFDLPLTLEQHVERVIDAPLEAVWGREVGSGSLTEIETKDAQLSRRRRLPTALLSIAVCRASAVLSPIQGQPTVPYYSQLSISVLTVFINNFGDPRKPITGSSDPG
ncbi:hypothetical protein EYF80_011456 [Liparis tanakae]|uniref:Uncharacterized protein n=1 Tax=Liparis tanakae TaxID=230148 RepID=A0A4Z2IK18_9TELE|nr:hypothetical protein EYF80_011456 [Liparis tanakae]